MMFYLWTEEREDSMPKHLTLSQPAARANASAAQRCRLTYHGLRRATQRNLSPDELDYIETYGRCFWRTGAIFYFLGARDLPASDRRDARATRLIGAVLIVENNALITAYRNPGALHYIKRKMKYRLSEGERAGFTTNPREDETLVDADDYVEALA